MANIQLDEETTINTQSEIRLSLPSKGRLADEALTLLDNAGFRVHKPNPRQYKAVINSLPGLTVLFQRPGDIVVSVGDGSVDFGITGWDVFCERRGQNGKIMCMLNDLRFGFCTLNVIVPESLTFIHNMEDLKTWQTQLGRPLRVATKFNKLTHNFLSRNGIYEVSLISAEGALESAPTIGYADIIVDLVSTGTTLRDNRLRVLDDGVILHSQACLIANRWALKNRPETLKIACQFMEFIVAYLRASENVAILANIRDSLPDRIADRIFTKSVIGGLQGPTISPVITKHKEEWYAIQIIVRKDKLTQAVKELRQIGGSGIVVVPVAYIFEEEPQSYQEMLTELEE